MEEGLALAQYENIIRAAGARGGAGVAEIMRAVGIESLFQVTCTELAALHRLMEVATVRDGLVARYIRTIALALNAVGGGESISDDANDCAYFIDQYYLDTIHMLSRVK